MKLSESDKATFSNINHSGGAPINGGDVRITGGKFDLVGTPAMLNYLSEIVQNFEKLNEEGPSEIAMRGIILALGQQNKILEDIAARLGDMEPVINVMSPPVSVNVPEAKTAPINVYPPDYAKIIKVFGGIFAALLFLILFTMLDSTYHIIEKL